MAEQAFRNKHKFGLTGINPGVPHPLAVILVPAAMPMRLMPKSEMRGSSAVPRFVTASRMLSGCTQEKIDRAWREEFEGGRGKGWNTCMAQ